MLLSIGLQNFKAFGDKKWDAPLSKINLIYGPNSGGKSSIIQALLLLKQSLSPGVSGRFPRLVPGGHLAPRGEYVDLGSLAAMAHKHDAERSMGIKLSYDGQVYPRRGADTRGPTKIQEITADMSFYHRSWISLSGERSWSTGFKSFAYRIVQNNQALMDGQWELKYDQNHHSAIERFLTIAGIRVPDELIAIDSLGFLPYLYVPGLTSEQGPSWEQRMAGLSSLAPVVELQRKLPPTTVEILQGTGLNESFNDVLESIVYLGPLRNEPQRIYAVSNSSRTSTGVRGEFVPEIIRDGWGFVDAINRWFRRFGIPYSVAIDHFGGSEVTGEYISLRLTDKRTNTKVSLVDVGFGINQLLPVIIEGIMRSTGITHAGRRQAIICVEQPEIHLHPRLQSAVADLMIDTIRGVSGNQWIVETHSEMLIRRIQRRVGEGSLEPDDVRVIYVEPHDLTGSEIVMLRLDKDGDFIDDWPDGFFEEGYNEIMAY